MTGRIDKRDDCPAGSPAAGAPATPAPSSPETAGGPRIGGHHTMAQLLRYAAPTIAMSIFTSLYGAVDGLFVSNFAGKTAFAAVNLAMPFIMVLSSVGFMLGSGGSALVARMLGRGDERRACGYFSLVVYVGAALGVLMSVVGAALMEPVCRALGATDDMIGTCVLYGRISMVSLSAFMLQYMFQSLFVTAGKPELGFRVTLVAGMANIVLDALFVGMLGWGVAGAAMATNVSEFIGGLFPLFYFARANASQLRLGRPCGGLRVVGNVVGNGSSEMVSVVAGSVVGMVYNWQLMNMFGENGVSAYGVIMYVGFIFVGIFEGYAVGVAPLMSYAYGAEDPREMRSLSRKGVAFMGVAGVAMLILSHLLVRPLSVLFVGYDQQLLELTQHAFVVYALAYLFMGLNVYGSSLFTALGNGKVSALTSFLRVLVFETGAVLLLPALVGGEGIWYSVCVAEVAALAVNAFFFLFLGDNYGYLHGEHRDRGVHRRGGRDGRGGRGRA